MFNPQYLNPLHSVTTIYQHKSENIGGGHLLIPKFVGTLQYYATTLYN